MTRHSFSVNQKCVIFFIYIITNIFSCAQRLHLMNVFHEKCSWQAKRTSSVTGTKTCAFQWSSGEAGRAREKKNEGEWGEGIKERPHRPFFVARTRTPPNVAPAIFARPCWARAWGKLTWITGVVFHLENPVYNYSGLVKSFTLVKIVLEKCYLPFCEKDWHRSLDRTACREKFACLPFGLLSPGAEQG